MKKMRTPLIAAIAIALLAGSAVSVAAHKAPTQKVCPGTLETVNADLKLSGSNCAIYASTTVNGKVSMKNGTLKVYGVVNGDIKQSGAGHVYVRYYGLVDGNITEKDGGRVQVEGHGSVTGNITENGSGYLNLFGYASVGGNVTEKDGGHLRVLDHATVDGNVNEEDGGVCTIQNTASVNGNLEGGCQPVS